MDPALLTTAAVFFGFVATVLWVNARLSRKRKPNTREVGYQRSDIVIDPRAVPEFKPTWQALRDKGEAR